MGLRIVFVMLVFLVVWVGGGIAFYDDLPALPGLSPAYTAMGIASAVALLLFALLVIAPTTRNRPE